MTIKEAQKDIVDHLRNRYRESKQNPWVKWDSLKKNLPILEKIYDEALNRFMGSGQLDIEFSLSEFDKFMRLGKSHVS